MRDVRTAKIITLMLFVAVIAGIIAILEITDIRRLVEVEEVPLHIADMTVEQKAMRYERAKEITTPDGFINTDAISVGELVGQKVILIDFWTYSCINCQRTTPYLNAWYETYKDQGLEIIGLHTPEFAFEEEYQNVLQAVENLGIKYPVVLDNDYSTWRAYRNRFWPHKYLIDIDGFIVYDHIGEGAYEETEMKIRELLEERANRLGMLGVLEDMAQPEDFVEVDFEKVRTPEIYFGSARNDLLANGLAKRSGLQTLEEPQTLLPNRLYLTGDWNFTKEFAESRSQAQIILQYDAKDVYFVASADDPVEITIVRDGQTLGTVTVQEERLYELIIGNDYGEHLIEIFIEAPGLKAFTFTFG